MPTPPRPTIAAPRERAPRFVVAALAAIAALVLLEILARLEGPAVCAGASGVLLEADPEVGWTYAKGEALSVAACPTAANERSIATPDVQAWRAPVSFSAAGLADQEWPEEKRPNEVRVLLLGNQTADGIGVARADRLSVRMMHLADRIRGARVSAINANIAAYATAEELRWLERVGLRYQPDVVVLLLDPVRDLRAAVHPVQVLPAADPLPPAGGLLDLSAAARWLARRPAARAHAPALPSEPQDLDGAPERQAARTRLQANVRAVADTARRAGATFAVVVAPPCPAVDAPPADLCTMLQDIAPCTDLGPTFAEVERDATRPVEICLPGFERWGRDAHFLASLRLWDLLQSAGLWPDGVVRGYRL